MNYLIGLTAFPKKPRKNKLFYDELIMMKKYFLIALASLTIGIAPLSTHANTFVVSQKSLEFDEYPYESCGETCPEIDYSFIDTGYNWLDAIINKDVVLGLSGYIEEGSSEDKEWQAFKNIKNPTDKQLANQTTKAIKKFSNENTEWIKEDKDNSPFSMRSVPNYLGNKQLKNGNHLELFSINNYQYLGGAHGLPTLAYYVFDMNNKKPLELDDVVISGKKSILEKLAYEAYIKYLLDQDINPDDMAETWEFYLTDNFSFNKDGITFLYQPYAIGPYVMGMPELTIKYQDLKGVIKAEYLD